MQRIETRTQLIKFIHDDMGQSAIRRACYAGTVEVLGGFSRVHPIPKPGWIVMITSVHEQTWLIAVIPYPHQHIFKAVLIESVPWQYYVGRNGPCDGEYSIYDGDNPEQACLARRQYDGD